MTNEHSYAGVRTPLYRPIQPHTDLQESSESWILYPKGCILKVLVNIIYKLILNRGNIGAQVVVGYQGETQLY